MIDGALVLEGGSLRSVFTAGVLDVLLEKDIELSYVNGVSAGAMCGINYVSRQPGRILEINQNYLTDPRYMSLKNLFRNRLFFNFDFLFGELSEHLVPLDYETFFQSKQRFVAVATRCKTGEAEFFEKGECRDLLEAVKASASMPMISRMVEVQGRKYLDGGISLPIAYQKAISEGYQKIVLVLTRDAGYQKPPLGRWQRRAYQHYFKPLPALLNALEAVPERYNRMQREIEALKRQGRLFVIRPASPVSVSRFERNKTKLAALYQEGRDVMNDCLEELRAYLEIT